MDGLWILTLLLGIPIGAAGALFYDSALHLLRARTRGRLRVRGAWGEFVPNSGSRQFSIGVISYNWVRRQYEFNGTNYNNDGSPFCHWRTVTSHVDLDRGEFHYVFATKDVRSVQTTSYGYGVVSLHTVGHAIAPQGGAYMYTVAENRAQQFDHSMKRLDIPDAPSEQADAVVVLSTAFPGEWAGRVVSEHAPD